MGLCACNSSGHLSNHADVAPNHAGITFAVSNTIVSDFIAHKKILISKECYFFIQKICTETI